MYFISDLIYIFFNNRRNSRTSFLKLDQIASCGGVSESSPIDPVEEEKNKE